MESFNENSKLAKNNEINSNRNIEYQSKVRESSLSHRSYRTLNY
jgi:hypothetical protein